MTIDLYRDAHVGIRARLAELSARMREREAEVTDAFWASLDHGVRERLASLREALELVDAPSLEELARAETSLAAYVDELGALIARLPSVEAAWHELPDEVPTPPPPPSSWWFERASSSEADGILRGLTAIVRERDRDAQVLSDGPNSYVTRFTDRGCPFALRATMLAQNGQVLEVPMWLVTSVPRAAARLLLRPETLMLSVVKALGIKREIEVGEPSFDGLFLIEGAKETAARYLLPGVRAQLLALSRFDIPTLEIDPPSRIASIQWRFEPAAKALDAAIRILTAIRETPPELRFRKE
ncbi:MAG: hypothetical protein KF819_21275 [Labilithrix sp.]|nr:hypothetical protein [Labilithrix sp.]